MQETPTQSTAALFDAESEYQQVIDTINRIQNYGLPHKLSVPKMVIIGDQSSGKSSVLEALTKLSFPRDKDMCTRFATQVNLRRNPALDKDILSARIEGEDDFNNLFSTVQLPMTFDGVIEQAVVVLCKRKNTDISDKVLEITLSGPTQTPLTIVDLPGFINTTSDGQDKSLPNTISAINMHYIQDPRTIILAVVQANVDLNTTRALSEAAKYDYEGGRTIPIVTKPDCIQNGLHPDWIEVILNRKKTMKHGYLVMRNTGYDQKNLTWETARQEEQRFFESHLWNAVPTDRKGRDSVKNFLSNVLFEHISRELPIVKREVDAAIDMFKRNLAALGTPIASTTVAREKLVESAMHLQPQVIAFLNADYDHNYLAAHKNKPISNSGEDPYFIRSSLLRLYKKYCSEMSSKDAGLAPSTIVGLVARYKGNSLPGFVDPVTFKAIINGHFLDTWRTITKAHVETMHKQLSDALSDFIAHKANPTARDVFTHVFDRFSRIRAIEIEKTMQGIIDDEATPFTLSRHYAEAVHKVRSKNSRIPSLPREPSSATDLTNGNSGNITPPLPTPGTSSLSNTEISGTILQPSQTGTPASFSSSPLMVDWDDVHTAEEMIPCLRAYLKTARERIVDKVLMETIERHMIKGIEEYFSMLLKATDGELQCMLESAALKRQRKDLETKLADFEGIMAELSK
ncbi:MAG: P-loop containing nucleoside triphosphate hydrolase protein [Linnemannia elongata]|nr:MAG: P-loop containing nucleoside triphosphate hydrolase protein [Linnemannia elongata]